MQWHWVVWPQATWTHTSMTGWWAAWRTRGGNRPCLPKYVSHIYISTIISIKISKKDKTGRCLLDWSVIEGINSTNKFSIATLFSLTMVETIWRKMTAVTVLLQMFVTNMVTTMLSSCSHNLSRFSNDRNSSPIKFDKPDACEMHKLWFYNNNKKQLTLRLNYALVILLLQV